MRIKSWLLVVSLLSFPFCAYAIATLNGTLSGLAAGQSVTILDTQTGSTPGTCSITMNSDGAFNAFNACGLGISLGDTYDVTVTAQPSSQFCTVTNGSGTFTVSFAPVIVTCAPPIPSLSEWTQLLLALMVMTVIGWHFHRERSY